MKLQIKHLNSRSKTPERNHESAGLDLFCSEVCVVDPGEVQAVRIGIATAFSPNYVGIIKDRSGVALKGLQVVAGVIDADYRGEWKVALYNSTRGAFTVERGDKIAQVLFLHIERPDVALVNDLPESDRGDGGFGSTGK